LGISSHASLALGLILALVTAAAFNWSWVAQHSITSRLPKLSVRHPWRSLALLFGHRRWLVAFMVGIAGWALYVLALKLAPLSLVQAVSAGGLALLAVLAQRAEGVRLPRREWVGVSLAVVGLVFLSASLAGGSSSSSSGSWQAVAAWFLVSFVGVGIAIGPGARYLAPGAGFGLAAGLMYAAADVGTKAAVHGGWLLAFGAPILGCHVLAFTLIQLSFQRGRALATAGLSSFCTNALPIVAGVTIYHESAPPGILGGLRFVAFACVVVGAAAVARGEQDPAARKAAEPVAPERPAAKTPHELPIPSPSPD
jgi:drug/metabolite transporter (DMT)-like permease